MSWLSDQSKPDTEPVEVASPRIMVVQQHGEIASYLLKKAGWEVVHDTNNPLIWLESLKNALEVDQIVVTPAALQVEAVAADIVKCMELGFTVSLFLDALTWLALDLEAIYREAESDG